MMSLLLVPIIEFEPFPVIIIAIYTKIKQHTLFNNVLSLLINIKLWQFFLWKCYYIINYLLLDFQQVVLYDK